MVFMLEERVIVLQWSNAGTMPLSDPRLVAGHFESVVSQMLKRRLLLV
jgi:hypothetical protein